MTENHGTQVDITNQTWHSLFFKRYTFHHIFDLIFLRKIFFCFKFFLLIFILKIRFFFILKQRLILVSIIFCGFFQGCKRISHTPLPKIVSPVSKILVSSPVLKPTPLSFGVFLPQNSAWKTALLQVLEVLMHAFQASPTHPIEIVYWFFQDDGKADCFERACAFFQEKGVIWSCGLSPQKSDMISKKMYSHLKKEPQEAPYKQQLILETAAQEEMCVFFFYEQGLPYRKLRDALRHKGFPEARLWYYRCEGDTLLFFHPEHQPLWSSEIPEVARTAKTLFIETKPIQQKCTWLAAQMAHLSSLSEGVSLVSLDAFSPQTPSLLDSAWIYPKQEPQDLSSWEQYQALYPDLSPSREEIHALFKKMTPFFQAIADDPDHLYQGLQDWHRYFWAGGKKGDHLGAQETVSTLHQE